MQQPVGTMTMYAYDEPKENHTLSGKEFATIMQKHLVKATKAYDFGPTKNSSLYVVRKTNMPAVITEALFVTNKDDRTYTHSHKKCNRYNDYFFIC